MTVAAQVKPRPWPKDTLDQVRAVADVLAPSPVPLSVDDVAARFTAMRAIAASLGAPPTGPAS